MFNNPFLLDLLSFGSLFACIFGSAGIQCGLVWRWGGRLSCVGHPFIIRVPLLNEIVTKHTRSLAREHRGILWRAAVCGGSTYLLWETTVAVKKSWNLSLIYDEVTSERSIVANKEGITLEALVDHLLCIIVNGQDFSRIPYKLLMHI